MSRIKKTIQPRGSAHDFINPLGLRAILNLCEDFKYGYDIDLFELTKAIEVRYSRQHQRERYGLDYISDIIRIFDHIKKERLLDK
ncbi:MAG: hypothetical protein ACRC2K_13220 [Clostridium sp.]